MKRPLLYLLALISLSVCLGACASSDEDESPYKHRKPRDPVEQRVFYDGWGER